MSTKAIHEIAPVDLFKEMTFYFDPISSYVSSLFQPAFHSGEKVMSLENTSFHIRGVYYYS